MVFGTYPNVLDYVTTTWLNPYKDRFAAARIDTCMHFGNVTSNRAEGAHSKLKRQLGLFQWSLDSSWTKIHALLQFQHADIDASFETSLTVSQQKFKSTEFDELRGSISLSSLEIILSQSKHANSVNIDDTACACILRWTHGLPCAHEIAKYNRELRPIPLECIDIHWRKLTTEPTKLSMPLSCKPELELIRKRFDESDEDTQLQILDKLKEIMGCGTSHVEPQIKRDVQGRPPLEIDMSTPCDPVAFELVISEQDSYSRL